MSNQLRIPEKRLESIILLSKIGDDAFKEIFTELAKLKKGFYQDSLISQAVSDLKHTSPVDAHKIVTLVVSLFSPLISSGKEISEFVDDILITLKANPKAETISKTDEDNLRSRLSSFLKIPSLSINAKAMSVLFENEKSFQTCRVLSEVRPVFGIEDDSISGALLIHTLKIEYVDSSGEDKEFFVTLDEKDIDELMSKLAREKRKSEKIRAMLSSGAIEIIEVDD